MVEVIRSRWVAPIEGEVIGDGAVVVDGRQIAAVGRYIDIAKQWGRNMRDLGDCVLMPGLINAHVHLELSDCAPGDRPTGGLEQWLTRMLSRTRVDQVELERKSAEAVKAGIEQCRRYGVTMVGDISRQCHVTRPILRDSRLRAVSFGEVMAMAQRRVLLEPRLAMASDRQCESDLMQIGLSPHSPYSIEMEGFGRCLDVAKAAGMPLATHLAETRSEWEFLARHTGPLRELWDSWLTWDDRVPNYVGGPIRMAKELGLLDYPTVLAHVNYCDDDEMRLIAAGSASVVYCPRTHEYFGHPPHRFEDMMRQGICVAVGTDSCASSPDLNIVDDLRLVHSRRPDVAVETLWRMVTVNAARALAAGPRVGALVAGYAADLVAFPSRGDEPLREVLETQVLPRYVSPTAGPSPSRCR